MGITLSAKFLVTMRIMDIAPLCTKEEIVEGHCKKETLFVKKPAAFSYIEAAEEARKSLFLNWFRYQKKLAR